MELIDYIPEEGLKALQQELHDLFELNADIMDADGKRLFGNTMSNDLCRAIRDDEKGFGGICVPAGAMFAMMMKDGEPFYEECDAGMMRVSVPVVVEDEVIGAIGGCGLVAPDGEADGFTIGMMSGVEEAVATAMAEKIEPVAEGRVEEIFAYIQKRIGELKK